MEADINILEFGLLIVVALAVGVAIALVLMRDPKILCRRALGHSCSQSTPTRTM
jgi:hypothetical protein